MRLALGTVQFGLPYGIANQSGQVHQDQVKRMLRLAATRGIRTLDTAISYGDSEACLGAAGIQEFGVVTKLPAVPESCVDIEKWVAEQVTASLCRLRTKAVHGLLLHRPYDLLGGDGERLYRALVKLKEMGLLRKVGVSVYSPIELDAVVKKFDIDIVQAPLNLVDRRLISSGRLDYLKAKGIEIHARSAFLQGLLLMPRSSIPLQFNKWDGLWGRWFDWLKAYNVSALQACLAFSLSVGGIDRVVVGADSVEQLEQIIDASSANSNWLDWPDIESEDASLINPALWSSS